MRLCVLGSGSGGNSLWVEAGPVRALVDVGLSLKETARRCAKVSLRLRDLTDVLLTHEHADHCHGAAVLARKLGVRVHATPGTLRALRDAPPLDLQAPILAGELVLGPLRVRTIALQHDATEPVAYSFEETLPDGRTVRAAIVTDLGCAPAPIAVALQGLDALILEMNHDLQMLLEGPYPWRLKQRIRGNLGHLSNDQGAKLLAQVLHPGLRQVHLAHLSEHNNTPAHAERAAAAVLQGSAASLTVARQDGPGVPFELKPGKLLYQRPRQLALFG